MLAALFVNINRKSFVVLVNNTESKRSIKRFEIIFVLRMKSIPIDLTLLPVPDHEYEGSSGD